MVRQFYLFAHNPNSVDEAIQRLKDGANALEPDVCYDPDSDRFLVHEQIPYLPRVISRWIYGGSTLEEYLTGLKERLQSDPDLNLALMAFDLKEPYSYDLNKLFDIIRGKFCVDFPKVSILVTVSKSDGMTFLSNQKRQSGYEAGGVDENTKPDEVNDFFSPLKSHYTYANGTSWWLTPTTKYIDDISRAIVLRNQGNGASFKLVYVWTVNSESSMRTFLDMDVNGMITNNVSKLSTLLESEYASKYCIATQKDTLFS